MQIIIRPHTKEKKMNHFKQLLLSFSIIITINAQETDWKPIVGPSEAIKTVQQPILVNNNILNTASSSRSSITFNGQTITTNIGDIGTNDASTPILTVDAPDFTSDIQEEPRYLGYSGGKILNGFHSSTATVSVCIMRNMQNCDYNK